jgi:uncharacterized membrane protein
MWEGKTVNKTLRTTLWVLSSLAVLWTITAVIGLARMGTMMDGGMMRAKEMGGTMNGMMMGMMLHMVLTWVVMLGLVGIFIYLVATARGPGRVSGA